MRITIEQRHVEKAYKEEGTRTLAQCCPVWQALHEAGIEASVGWTGSAYVIYRVANGMPTGEPIARIEPGTPLYDVADWFDSPCSRGTVKLDEPIVGDLELFN